MSVLIRDARPDDAEAIVQMIGALAAHHGDQARIDTRWISREVMGAPARQAGALIAEADDKPVGYAIWYAILNAIHGVRILDLHNLYVEPEFRRAGLGRAMMRRVVSLAKTEGFARVGLGVAAANVDAQKFYERLGFRPGSQQHPRLVLRAEDFARVLGDAA